MQFFSAFPVQRFKNNCGKLPELIILPHQNIFPMRYILPPPRRFSLLLDFPTGPGFERVVSCANMRQTLSLAYFVESTH